MGLRLFSKRLLCLFLLVIVGSQLSLLASSHLAIHSLDAFPSIIDDTSTYHLELYVVNEDPTHPWTGDIDVLLSVDGDDPSILVAAFSPISPVLPGDSLLVSLDDYGFDPSRFSGGGITHDIIVWPSRIGTTIIDSADAQVVFMHTQDQSSEHIGLISSGGFPPIIIDGQTYSLTFEVLNLDPTHYIIDPISLYLSVNGDTGTVLALDITSPQPIAPGASLQVAVPNYLFDPGRFSGGGITHDIIVWPMTLTANQVDSFHTSVRHLSQAAFDMDISSASGLTSPINPHHTYQLLLTTQNIGPQASSTDLDFYLQLDANRPVIVGNKSGAVLSDHATSLSLSEFRLADFYPSIVNQAKFAKESHMLRFWATESHIESWAQQSMLHIPADRNIVFHHPFGSLQWQQLSIFPNPSSGETSLLIELDHITDIDVYVYDLSGRQVKEQHWSSKMGSTELGISLSDLPNGMYLYQLQTDTNHFQGRIVKE